MSADNISMISRPFHLISTNKIHLFFHSFFYIKITSKSFIETQKHTTEKCYFLLQEIFKLLRIYIHIYVHTYIYIRPERKAEKFPNRIVIVGKSCYTSIQIQRK